MTGASESWKEPNLSSFFATNAAEGINATSSCLSGLGVIVPLATAVLNGFGGSGEVSADSDLDVLLEVVIDGLLSHDTALLVSNGPHDIFEPVVDISEVEGNVLSLLVQDDIRRSSGMDVQVDIELGEDVPELVVGGLVVVEVGLAIGTGGLEVGTEGTVRSELLNTATQLLVSLLRVVHGRTANAPMPSRSFLDLVRRPVVGLSGSIPGQGFVGKDTGNEQGYDGVANAMGVKQTDTLIVYVEDLAHVANTVLAGNVKVSFGALRGFLDNNLAQDVES
ncbi:hypothetical protein N7499_006425 [Penicillium canescens]|nr:hypothetical protein N7499_006425 [Penicillium canescens]